MNFVIIKQKKESVGLPAYRKWSGVIEAKAKKKLLLEKNYPLLSITVKDIGGKIEVRCQPAQKSHTKHQNSFFEYLKIRVNE
ncbi:MAG: hypothetical protein WCC06_00965 [Candidatus Aminicenantales bacterium]